MRTAVLVLGNALFWVAHYLWILVMGVVGLPMRLGTRRTMWRVLAVWARGELLFARVFTGVRYRVIGAEHIPHGAALVVSKHQSNFESIALPLLIPELAVVLRYQLLGMPLWGPMVRRLDMIPIDREGGAGSLRALLRAAREKLDAGRPVLIFPEARRVPIGERAPYQRGVLPLYEKLGVPVVPVALDAGLYWPPDFALMRPGCITLRFLPPLPPGLPREAFFATLQQQLDSATDELLAAGARGR